MTWVTDFLTGKDVIDISNHEAPAICHVGVPVPSLITFKNHDKLFTVLRYRALSIKTEARIFYKQNLFFTINILKNHYTLYIPITIGQINA